MAAALGWSETAAAGSLVLVAGWWGSLMMLTETKREVQRSIIGVLLGDILLHHGQKELIFTIFSVNKKRKVKRLERKMDSFGVSGSSPSVNVMLSS
ncbi:transmembrane protein, putative [Medicago truncatula]|uniref:Transmembrane protein, putative n=1 Tax=Medicago truncatula TaxID=3880 RepID=A0A072U3S1_MEDTR|nr:transmembrane protein, putative [Medicago truncatula]